MISISRDGDLIARIAERWGVAAVRGSSHDHVKRRQKGGGQAYIGAARELVRNGALVGITPDGPRGPRMQAQSEIGIGVHAHEGPLAVTFEQIAFTESILWRPQSDDDLFIALGNSFCVKFSDVIRKISLKLFQRHVVSDLFR